MSKPIQPKLRFEGRLATIGEEIKLALGICMYSGCVEKAAKNRSYYYCNAHFLKLYNSICLGKKE